VFTIGGVMELVEKRLSLTIIKFGDGRKLLRIIPQI
jgi:hypothetical protein